MIFSLDWKEFSVAAYIMSNWTFNKLPRICFDCWRSWKAHVSWYLQQNNMCVLITHVYCSHLFSGKDIIKCLSNRVVRKEHLFYIRINIIFFKSPLLQIIVLHIYTICIFVVQYIVWFEHYICSIYLVNLRLSYRVTAW
jgi:hypothetical protein